MTRVSPLRSADIFADRFGRDSAALRIGANPGTESGFFRFGPDIVGYGRCAATGAATFTEPLPDVMPLVDRGPPGLVLPFDPGSVADNLRYERYIEREGKTLLESSWIRSAYYLFRPYFPVGFRKHLQNLYLRGRKEEEFPAWPIDCTVDLLIERVVSLALEASGVERIPFIWFWPESATACAIVTHDVETTEGRDFCRRLIEVDGEYGVRSSYQIVPEVRYEVPSDYLDMIREGACEINLHGLDHDGDLFGERYAFLTAAARINEYGRHFGARGFRSPALYRNVDWFQDLDFSYDLTFPSVARFEAQPGGCCTVLPYFLPGDMLELPLTLAEDYTLFNIRSDYSTAVWSEQIEAIRSRHGLITVLVHPDYIQTEAPMNTYRSLLEKLARLRDDERVWLPLPGEVDAWWRARREMRLVPAGTGWTIEGPGSERARVAWASVRGDRLTYEIEAG